jgi:hypothetical protein
MRHPWVKVIAIAAQWVCVGVLILTPATLALYASAALSARSFTLFGRSLVGETRVYCSVGHGTVFIDYVTGWAGTPPRQSNAYPMPGIEINKNTITLTGQRRGDRFITIRIQFWLLLCFGAVCLLVAIVWARHLMNHRRKPGTCRNCGYDLRATPDRCPECGTPITGRCPVQ